MLTTEQKLTRQMTARIASRTTISLVEMARVLNDDMKDGAEIVLDAVLAELMTRMDETTFVAFCERMDDYCEQAMDGVRMMQETV